MGYLSEADVKETRLENLAKNPRNEENAKFFESFAKLFENFKESIEKPIKDFKDRKLTFSDTYISILISLQKNKIGNKLSFNKRNLIITVLAAAVMLLLAYIIVKKPKLCKWFKEKKSTWVYTKFICT